MTVRQIFGALCLLAFLVFWAAGIVTIIVVWVNSGQGLDWWSARQLTPAGRRHMNRYPIIWVAAAITGLLGALLLGYK